MIQLRKKSFNMLKASLPQKLERCFKEYMIMRNYKATLDIRDDERSIIIKVETHKKTNESLTISAEQSHRNSGNNDGESEQRLPQRRGIMQDLKGELLE